MTTLNHYLLLYYSYGRLVENGRLQENVSYFDLSSANIRRSYAEFQRNLQFGTDNQFTLEPRIKESVCSSQIDDDTEKANILL